MTESLLHTVEIADHVYRKTLQSTSTVSPEDRPTLEYVETMEWILVHGCCFRCVAIVE